MVRLEVGNWPVEARKRPPLVMLLRRYSGSGMCGFSLILPWPGASYKVHGVLVRPVLALTVDWS